MIIKDSLKDISFNFHAGRTEQEFGALSLMYPTAVTQTYQAHACMGPHH